MITCPYCGKTFDEPIKTRDELFDDNAKLCTLDEWINHECGTYEEYLERVKEKAATAKGINQADKRDFGEET